jgi:hypothetical protein
MYVYNQIVYKYVYTCTRVCVCVDKKCVARRQSRLSRQAGVVDYVFGLYAMDASAAPTGRIGR